jgi:hypothetical protein
LSSKTPVDDRYETFENFSLIAAASITTTTTTTIIMD